MIETEEQREVRLAKKREYNKKYYYNNLEKERARHREYCKNNPDVVKRNHEKWAKRRKEYRKEHQKEINEHTKARRKEMWYQYIHTKTERYINKYNARQNKCAICSNECKSEAHHLDYSKRNEVVFLCHSCHQKVHNWLECNVNPVDLLAYKNTNNE